MVRRSWGQSVCHVARSWDDESSVHHRLITMAHAHPKAITTESQNNRRAVKRIGVPHAVLANHSIHLESPRLAFPHQSHDHTPGGLDSSLVASVACRHVRDHPDSELLKAFPRIHSFSVGLANSPDLKVGACSCVGGGYREVQDTAVQYVFVGGGSGIRSFRVCRSK